jgi:energy-coupling factor transporter ATP-binding protein EcfA2
VVAQLFRELLEAYQTNSALHAKHPLCGMPAQNASLLETSGQPRSALEILKEIGLHFGERLSDYPALEASRFKAERLFAAYAWKCGLAPGFPLIVCLVGGTGTGKSTLFNSLAGRRISEVGTRRPYTLKAVVLAHEDVAGAMAGCPFLDDKDKESVIVSHSNPGTARLILVDTPDFDSVELSNRLIADNFFVISDVMVLVTSQEKYGDLAGHQISHRGKQWSKKIVFIMNKVASETAFRDFANTLKANGFQEPIRVERMQPAPDLIAGLPDRPEFKPLLDGKDAEHIRVKELENLRRQTLLALEHLIEALAAESHKIASVNDKIQDMVGPIANEMDSQLHAVVTQDMEEQIRDHLQRLLRKYDILFVPRMMVRNAIKRAFLSILQVFSTQPQEQLKEKDFRAEDFIAARAAVRLKPLESAVSKLNVRIAEMLSADHVLDDLRRVARDDVPRWDSEEIQKRYDQAFPGIEHLLELEFDKLRQGLSFTDEVKLYGSYTVWALLLITAEIAVGGGLSFLDVFLDTVIVPLIPKWLLNLKVLDVLRDVAERVDEAHRSTLKNILSEQAELYLHRFNGMLPAPDSVNKLELLTKRLQDRCSDGSMC